MSGLHLLHKPVGPTSFAVLNAFRAQQRINEPACHGGTLDPFASGLLLVLIEPATKLFDYLHAIPKTYLATVRWGTETDTGDALGKAVSDRKVLSVSEHALDECLKPFRGWHEQVPPATSAKRVAGVRAYERVHRGESVQLPASRVYLHQVSWINHDLPHESTLHLVVRGGYYVRALARDLGRALCCGAHLSALRRRSIGPWNDPQPGQSIPITGQHIMSWAPVRQLNAIEVSKLRQRQPIPSGELEIGSWPLPPGFPDPSAPVRGFYENKFRFLLRLEGDQLHHLTTLRAGL